MGILLYGPTTISSTAPIDIAPNPQLANCAVIAVSNDTSYGLSLSGVLQDFLLPQQSKYYASDDFYGQDLLITPVVILSGTFTGLPQQITIVGYKHGEATPPPGTTVDLGKLVIVANAVSTVGGTATNVQNDANVAGTSVVEATVSGDGASAVSITNNGHVIFGSAANPAQLTFHCALGDITVDANGKVTIPDQLLVNLLTAITGNDLALHVGSGQRVVATVNGVDTFEANGSGAELLAGNLFLPNDGNHVSGFSFFGPYTISTTQANFNHNLNVTPDIILCQAEGGISTSRTINIGYGFFTSTQFPATGNGSFQFSGIAIKF